MLIASIARLLAERGLSTAAVTSASGTLLGIVTELDLIRRLGEEGRAARYRPGGPGVKGVDDNMEEGIPRSALY
jgi:CBS domain-containing protein